MAFIIFYFVVTMATLGSQVDASCSNKVTLENLEIIDQVTGNVLQSLPLRADKLLKVKLTVKANAPLNSASYTAKLRLEASIHHAFGTAKQTISCPPELPACEISHQSCNQLVSYLSKGVVCPVLGLLTTEFLIPLIGDVTGTVNSVLLLILRSADLVGHLDIFDDTTGEQVACITKKIHLFKDF